MNPFRTIIRRMTPESILPELTCYADMLIGWFDRSGQAQCGSHGKSFGCESLKRDLRNSPLLDDSRDDSEAEDRYQIESRMFEFLMDLTAHGYFKVTVRPNQKKVFVRTDKEYLG